MKPPTPHSHYIILIGIITPISVPISSLIKQGVGKSPAPMSRLARLAFVIRRIGATPQLILSDGDDGLDARVRVQKIAYFLKQLGFGFDYDFDQYYHGPYSQALANDYYTLAGLGDGEINELALLCEKANECSEAMGNMIDNLNKWGTEALEVASLIHDLYTDEKSDYRGDLDGAIDTAKFLKPWVDDGIINRALGLLRSLGLLSG
jgi:uncharacterized protein YwgA